MDYVYVEEKVKFLMGLLNGKVNKLLCYRYDFIYGDINGVCAEGSYGKIVFYPARIIKKYGDQPKKVFDATLLCITVHELSHMDQLIQFSRYVIDDNYRMRIEDGCNKRTYQFILNNINALHAAYGEFDEMVIDDIANSINFNTTRYEVATNYQQLLGLVGLYLPNSSDILFRMENIDIILGDNLLYSGKIVIKNHDRVADFNKVAPLLYSTTICKEVNVIPECEGDDSLHIYIKAYDKIYNRVATKYA